MTRRKPRPLPDGWLAAQHGYWGAALALQLQRDKGMTSTAAVNAAHAEWENLLDGLRDHFAAEEVDE